jgi:hypothetical protein
VQVARGVQVRADGRGTRAAWQAAIKPFPVLLLLLLGILILFLIFPLLLLIALLMPAGSMSRRKIRDQQED